MAISPMKETMLRALSYYKYLTVSHIKALGISRSNNKIRDYFRSLRNDWGLTGRQINYSISNKEMILDKTPAHRKRREDLHFLTLKGVRFLDTYTELNLEAIRYPKKSRMYLANDYFHRVSTISIHISFEKWVEENNLLNKKVLQYYRHNKQRGGRSFESETRLQLENNKHYTPDMIFGFSNQRGEQQVFCLELYNGDKVKYATEQLKKLFRIIDNSNKVEQKVNLTSVPRILCVCDNEKLMKQIQKRMRNDQFFWVNHIENLIFFNLDKNIHQKF